MTLFPKLESNATQRQMQRCYRVDYETNQYPPLIWQEPGGQSCPCSSIRVSVDATNLYDLAYAIGRDGGYGFLARGQI